MARMLRVPRSRGAASGVLLILLGAWGGLAPFVGPYLHYAYTPAIAWTWNIGRLWLEVLPAAAALIGGLIVSLSRLRPFALFGALLAALGGIWFAVGGALAPLWSATPPEGTPVGGTVARALEQIGFFSGLGAVIVLTASVAMGRLAMISAKDMQAAAAWEAAKAARASTPVPAVVPIPASTGDASAPDKAGEPDDTSAPDISTADTITPTPAPGEPDKGGWRLVGRASPGGDESGDPAS